MTNKHTYYEWNCKESVSKKQYYVCFKSVLEAQLSIHKLSVVFNHPLLFWQNSQTSAYNHSLQLSTPQSHLINNFFSITPLPVCDWLARCQIYTAITNTIGWISQTASTSAGNTFCIHYFFYIKSRKSSFPSYFLALIIISTVSKEYILSAVRFSSSASHTLLFK